MGRLHHGKVRRLRPRLCEHAGEKGRLYRSALQGILCEPKKHGKLAGRLKIKTYSYSGIEFWEAKSTGTWEVGFSWVGYNTARCGGCILSLCERKGAALYGRALQGAPANQKSMENGQAI